MIDYNDFRKSFGDVYSNKSKYNKKILSKSTFDSTNENYTPESSEKDIIVDQEEYSIQRIVREWFNKGSVNSKATIGTHPDFIEINGTDDYINQHITTIFVDIKNSILRAASELVRAMDGHVHRFMGDALMAYFGSKSKSKESSAMEAISCASMLRVFMSESVLPFLKEKFDDDFDIGFRVGIDFGDDNEILWASYGYGNVTEVTATSFFVDVASKLQSLAGKDQIMLGENIIKFIDLPEKYQKIKTKTINNEETYFPLLKPNYQLRDGTKLNYKIRQLVQEKFIEILPIPTFIKSKFSNNIIYHNGISFQSFTKNNQSQKKKYHSISECLDKNLGIDFILSINRSNFNQNKFPLRYKFIKTNHGQEAENNSALEEEEETGVVIFQKNRLTHQYDPAKVLFSRSSAYRGLHTVKAQVLDNMNNIIYSEVIGVHIK